MEKYGLKKRASRWCASGLIALAGAAVLLTASASHAQIQWRTGTGQVPQRMTKAVLADTLRTLASRENASRVVVHLSGPVTDAEKQTLAAQGVTLLSYLGSNAYFGSLSSARIDATAAAAADQGKILMVEAIATDWKMHPDTAAGIVHPWAVVPNQGSDRPKDALPGEAGVEQAKLADPTVALYVLFHPDVDLMTEGARTIRSHGATVRSWLTEINGAVIHISNSRIREFTASDPVMYVEPPLPMLSECNAENRVLVQANIANAAPYNLNGAGVDVLVYDGGKVKNNPEHVAMTGRVTIGPSDTSSVSDHATHVTGTILGDGTGSAGGIHIGMAPAARVISYGFQQPGGLQQGFLYTDPGDLQADYSEAISLGADISNNSIGTNTSTNGFPCDWQGNYGVTDVLIDKIVRGTPGIANGQPFRIVWANGNERQSTRCQNLPAPFQQYHLTAPPACAKNHITVGATNANDDSMTSFSSWGPADDGRMKPDVSAPGCQVGGDGGVTSSGSSGGYNVKCGTSMASPTTCGVSALLIQDWRNNYPSEPDMRNSLLKCFLAHTATDRGNPGPDNQFGYGSIRAPAAADLLRSGNFIAEEFVSQGEVYAAVVVVQPGDTELKVTLAWDDAPGTPVVNPALVNDLDLVVRSPSNVQHFPWTLGGLADPAAPAVRTQPNHVDNIEQVFVSNPEVGGWTIEIHGFNVPQGPQPFSLTATPFLVNCSDAGTVALNSVKYPCESSASIRVIDCGLNTSDLIIDTVNVTIDSGSEPGGEVVTLTETAAESATFLGSINLSTTNSAGVLQVANGDTVTVTYNDADTGGGSPAVVTDTSTVDCAPPTITNVAAINIQPRDATITFDTNELAKGTVRYGTACGSLTETVAGAAFTTSHSLNLTGLQDNTTYFFVVDAEDEAGNESTNDNGGNCFSFTTPEVPDFYTEDFTVAPGGSNDTDNQSFTFTPDSGVDFYSLCVEPITVLPTDPAGGTPITFPSTQDDQFVALTVSGGESVKLYGASYTTVYVGSNGYVTFTAGDTDYTEAYADHFDLPRISCLFDDLHPGQGGQVSWKQLSDRFVVTWLNVPEYNGSNQNTFQIEMYFDGRIVVSYLGVAAADGLAGLSAGDGLDPDFLESDLTSYGDCGPRPPNAASVSVETPTNVNVDVTLVASDDGKPGPLSYIITSLPPAAEGKLFDPNASGQITTVPYTLVGNGNIVTFDPASSFQGQSSFTYKANDGGTPPEGGDSNIATVTVTVGVPTCVYSFDLNTNPGWTMDPDWAFGQPQGLSGDPAAGFTGTNVLGYNLAGDYPNNLSPVRYLTTGALDCSNLTQVTIEFRRWLGIESATYDHANLQISTNGTTWINVWEHTGGSINESAWSFQSYDVSAIADGQPTVYFRWGMGTTDASVVYHGWNIDDICIKALQPVPPACVGDLDGDDDVDSTDLNILLTDFGCTSNCIGDLDDDDDTDSTDLNILLSVFGNPC